MQTGTKISAALHVGLLGWAFLGGAFRSEPLPFEVQEVTVISSQEFAALTGQSQTPEVSQTPEALSEAEAVPDTPTTPDVAPEPVQPEPTAAPQPDPVPETLPDPAPQPPEPPVDVVEPPVQPEPQVEPVPDAVLITQSPRPKPRPVERIAPEPVAAPPPDATPDVDVTPAVTPDAGAETPQDQEDATAPEEATDQTVTEADETAEVFAPSQSPRPTQRPSRPQPSAPDTQTAEAADQAEDAPEQQNDPDTTAAVNAALAEALLGNDSAAAGASTETAPSGPPLTSGEKDALRVAVSRCWNVGSLSSAALATTVVVGVQMSEDGKPDIGSIRMVSSENGSPEAAKQAFEAARRAIIRCGSSGFDLPVEKYDHWRDIEMTFNPERMRIR